MMMMASVDWAEVQGKIMTHTATRASTFEPRCTMLDQTENADIRDRMRPNVVGTQVRPDREGSYWLRRSMCAIGQRNDWQLLRQPNCRRMAASSCKVPERMHRSTPSFPGDPPRTQIRLGCQQIDRLVRHGYVRSACRNETL